MAVADFFLKLDGIEGESQDSKHSKEVEILQYQFKGTQQGTTGSATGGGGKGRVKLEDLLVWKKIDKASPKLFQHHCSGEPIKKIVLTGRKAGKDQQDYLKITLTDCIVSQFNHGATPGGDGGKTFDDWEHLEQIGFNFATIDYSYKEQKADGTLGGEIKGGWHAVQNKPL
ncbi:MAG TPA: type VI secretion system tube protein Hcp [Bryobacteraceae bacterium]|nr:type VI secretion system tube protein Hcp [Bryobacteraceae bacterium]